jgi:hypothetical protein
MNNEWELVPEDGYISSDENEEIYTEDKLLGKNNDKNWMIGLNEFKIISKDDKKMSEVFSEIVPFENEEHIDDLMNIGDDNKNEDLDSDIVELEDDINDIKKTQSINHKIDDTKSTYISLVNSKQLINKIPNSIWINLAFYILKYTESSYCNWRIILTYSCASTMILCFKNRKYLYKVSQYSLTNIYFHFIK